MTAMEPRPQILCIDDDPRLLEGLVLSLRKLGELHTAESGAAALAMIDGLPQLALVVCDLQMPRMDGAQMLAELNRRRPDATRILLTGHADVEAAMAAVNEGRVFRFLAKPCPPTVLQEACAAGLRQHEALRREHDLLDRTLKGCIDAMTDALAMASPAVFGHAQRVRGLAAAVARQLLGRSDWVLEIAAMLLHLGLVGLPDEVVERLLRGEEPEPRHRAQAGAGCRHAMDTLKDIPRLGPVRDVMRLADPAFGGNLEWTPATSDMLRQWSQILRTVRTCVQLEAAGFPLDAALLKLRRGTDAALLEALSAVLGKRGAGGEVREVGLAALEAGMVLARPLYAAGGQLLAPAGYEVRPGFARRLAETRPELRGARLSVIVPPQPNAAPPVEPVEP
jgi:CheY-like chemotaxis protein